MMVAAAAVAKWPSGQVAGMHVRQGRPREGACPSAARWPIIIIIIKIHIG